MEMYDDDFNASEFELRRRKQKRRFKIGFIFAALVTLAAMILFWR